MVARVRSNLAARSRAPNVIGAGVAPEDFRLAGVNTVSRGSDAPRRVGVQEPTETGNRSLSGKVGGGMQVDYYNRVYAIPAVIDLQNPQVGQPQPYSLWNAFIGDNEIVTIDAQGDTGISNTAVVGDVFRSLQLRSFSVAVQPGAPIAIEARYTFTFTLGTVVFQFNATQATILSIPPEMPVEQILEYETDIFRSNNGTERRFAIRGNQPRQQLTYNLIFTSDQERRELRLQQFLNNLAPAVFPMWQEPFVATSEIPIGSTTISGDFTFSDLIADDTVFIISPDGQIQELNNVVTVGPNLLTLRNIINDTYPVGTSVYPTIIAQPPDGRGIQMYPVNAFRQAVRGRSVTQRALGGAGATVNLYQGLPLLEPEPSANGLVTETYSRQPVEVDFGGVFDLQSNAQFSNISRPVEFYIPDRERLQYWKRFLDLVHGRRDPFYAPTHQFDVVPQLHIPGTAEVQILNSPNINQWLSSAGRSDLRFVLGPEPVIAYRRVTTISDLGNGSVILTLDTALPSQGPATTISKISLLELSRLGSDRVRFRHFDTHSRIQISLETIEQ